MLGDLKLGSSEERGDGTAGGLEQLQATMTLGAVK